jgi:hypothetical protein
VDALTCRGSSPLVATSGHSFHEGVLPMTARLGGAPIRRPGHEHPAIVRSLGCRRPTLPVSFNRDIVTHRSPTSLGSRRRERALVAPASVIRPGAGPTQARHGHGPPEHRGATRSIPAHRPSPGCLPSPPPRHRPVRACSRMLEGDLDGDDAQPSSLRRPSWWAPPGTVTAFRQSGQGRVLLRVADPRAAQRSSSVWPCGCCPAHAW